MLTINNESGESPHDKREDPDPVISDGTLQAFEIIFYVVLCGILGVFGSIANVINIIIFCKQGFKESVNISLIGLALSDLGILVPLVGTSICYNPLVRYSNTDFNSVAVELVIAGMPNAVCVRITSWIVALIAFERCVCIAIPVKVRDIITPKRTLITVVAIYLSFIISAVPYYCYVYLAPYFHQEQNRTLVGVRYVVNDTAILQVSSSMIVAAQLSSFIIVIICAVVLIFNLQIKSRWRQKITSVPASHQAQSLASRDKRVMKMVTIISCTFIICNLPGTVNVVLMVQLYPEYSVDGRYYNSYNMASSIVTTLEAINSSFNIFIYYNMSSRFREIAKKFFGTGLDNVKTI